MKKLSYLFILIQIPIFSFAFNFHISLSQERLDIQELSYHISDIIDARKEKKIIGYVKWVSAHAKTPAKFSEPIIKEFTGLFQRSKIDYGNKAIILKINRILIYEQILNNGKSGFVELNISFLEKRGNQYFELLEVAESGDYPHSNLNNNHSSNIALTITKVLKYFNTRLNIQKLNERIIGENSHESQSSLKRYAILQKPKYQRTLFWNFADFRDNLDVVNEKFEVKYFGLKVAKLKKINRQERIDLTKLWGFCDGDNFYKRVGKRFYKLEIEKDHIWLYGPELDKDVVSPAIATFVGGLIGYYLYTVSNVGPETGNRVQKYHLDFKTGGLLPDGADRLDEFVRTLIFVSNDNNNHPIKIKTPNEECQISPQQYYILNIHSGIEEIEVCFDVNGEELCEKFKPKLFQVKFYEIKAVKQTIPKISEWKFGTDKGNMKIISNPNYYSRACEN